MARVYCFVTCQLDKVQHVCRMLMSLPNVEGVKAVYGAYDIVVEIDSADSDLTTTLAMIRKEKFVQTTTTLRTIEEQE